MLTVRLDSDIPLAEQIAVGLRTAIASGELRPGDPLPPVRQLAGDLGVNLNTVARAYRDLEKSGLLASTRGRGTQVLGHSEKPRPPRAQAQRRLAERLQAVLTDARLPGLSSEDVRHLVEQQIPRFWKTV